MALRVLLADESSTIRKVFQLALQDYAVDVKAVHNGLDVVAVGKQFKPDIIFTDVLLAKKSGYDVAAELKQENDLKTTPVVLMWSSFMELDKDKYQASQAEAHLEKPFDVQKLRSLIQQFVPKTKDQTLSKYLTFPEMPAFEEAKKPESAPKSSTSWNMESFDRPEEVEEAEEFLSVALKTGQTTTQVDQVQTDDEQMLLDEALDEGEDMQNDWRPKTLTKFKVKLPEEDESNDVPVTFAAENLNEKEDSFELEIEVEDKETVDQASVDVLKNREKMLLEAASNQGLSQERLEEIVREECKKMLESVIWKVVPDLAKSLIEKELNNLLSDNDSSARNFTST